MAYSYFYNFKKIESILHCPKKIIDMHVLPDLPNGIKSMRHLFIIGNGFDITHRFKTRYLDFKQWLESTNPQLIYKMSEYFPFWADNSDIWWSNFEANLISIDAPDLIDRNVRENYPDFASDTFRDADYHAAAQETEKEISELYNNIGNAFEAWIKQVDISSPCLYMKIPRDAFYLNFNYTDTLESVYNIDQNNILYIHGKTNKDDVLIYGHRGNPHDVDKAVESYVPQPPENLPVERYEDWYAENSDDYIVESSRGAARSAIMRLAKDTANIIEQYRVFFGRCTQLDHISIYGFSYSEIDMPYLRTIIVNIDVNKVLFSLYYYSDGDFAKCESIARAFGLKRCEIIPTNQFPNSTNCVPEIPGLF